MDIKSYKKVSMNYLKKLFSTQPVNVNERSSTNMTAEEKSLLDDCKLFLATGKATDSLQFKITHYQKDDSRLSDYEAVELILDHNERLQKK